MKVVNIYYFPFDGGSSVYDSACNYFNESGSDFFLQKVKSQTELLLLPFNSIVMVEAISTIKWGFFLRLDLRVFHTPRGGASLKVGWKSLGKLNWHTRLRLKRRNYVLARNEFIARYYGFEEETPIKKYLIGHEIVDEYFGEMPIQNNSVHVSLSECWSGDELLKIITSIIADPNFSKKVLSLSLHPQVKLTLRQKDKLGPYIQEFGSKYIPEIYITDCVSTVFSADVLNLDIRIVKERQTPDRALIFPQGLIFCLNNKKLSDNSSQPNVNYWTYVSGSSQFIKTQSVPFKELIYKVQRNE